MGVERGGGWVALKNKLVRAQRRVRCKLPGQARASERQAQMSTEGSATLKEDRKAGETPGMLLAPLHTSTNLSTGAWCVRGWRWVKKQWD